MKIGQKIDVIGTGGKKDLQAKWSHEIDFFEEKSI